MKTISINLDEELMSQIDQLANQLHLTPQMLTENSLRTTLARAKELDLAERDASIYELFPVTPDEFAISPDQMSFGDPWEKK